MDSVGGFNGYTQGDENRQVRRRYGEDVVRRRYSEMVVYDEDEEGVYNELERLRGIVDQIESERNTSCLKFSLNNSVMSMIFGLVFVVIMSVTIYAFSNLFRAVFKRVMSA